jgi:F-type H+-transporting ATPase subunit gamma
MANLKEIQRKIKSVSNTQKTTRAMKLVSTAKLRRTEELARKSKVYATKLNEVMSKIANNIENSKADGIESIYFNPSQQQSDIKKVAIAFVTADKGLCGGFNIQTIKTVRKLSSQYQKSGAEIKLYAVGKKGVEFFTYNKTPLEDKVTGLSSSPDYVKATNFITKIVDEYISGKVDKVILIHNGYKNMISQELKEIQLLPIEISSEKTDNSILEIEAYNEEIVLESLVKKYLEYNMYYSLIDSLAAEHSARMQAMDSATNNAKEMKKNLQVKYNKARQESITTELIEIISGVESMK